MATKRPRTLDGFFSQPAPKKQRAEELSGEESIAADSKDIVTNKPSREMSTHPAYPHAIPHLPAEIIDILNFAPATEPRIMNDQPDLDLLYYQPYIPKEISKPLFEFLRRELFFYRVKYNIKRGSVETQINTPRYTTVFGLDETARFDADGHPVDAGSGKAVKPGSYKVPPRPIPQCLGLLRVEPAIASFTLGATRDFLLKHKPTEVSHVSETKPMKLPLASGDMVLMKGMTQSRWLHSIPKRKGGDTDKGRINITFRRAMVKGGTDNYYRYNVGDGEVYRWDESRREMMPWKRP
ncbi:hypothetical protein LTR97_001619 [Elasticomyces elasticus]|uniref:Alpha-ketoglutarate-dependent dioxygenase AlkB-like domain-containing protein n=1 Tax=Elasticomyces elasticus TaxID=574655 RepID=A0AAN8A625_9PEZI|nr:hypothetical protein LTR97_001619 [Elasticomyces elasticus]